MALTAKVETWATKKAQIDKKKLEIEDLKIAKNAALAPIQESLNTTTADYDSQISAKRSEISTLEDDIRALAI